MFTLFFLYSSYHRRSFQQIVDRQPNFFFQLTGKKFVRPPPNTSSKVCIARSEGGVFGEIGKTLIRNNQYQFGSYGREFRLQPPPMEPFLRWTENLIVEISLDYSFSGFSRWFFSQQIRFSDKNIKLHNNQVEVYSQIKFMNRMTICGVRNCHFVTLVL